MSDDLTDRIVKVLDVESDPGTGGWNAYEKLESDYELSQRLLKLSSHRIMVLEQENAELYKIIQQYKHNFKTLQEELRGNLHYVVDNQVLEEGLGVRRRAASLLEVQGVDPTRQQTGKVTRPTRDEGEDYGTQPSDSEPAQTERSEDFPGYTS